MTDSGFVYAIESGDAVKIGFARDPIRRLSELNVGSPHDHRLLGMKPGTREDEAHIHHRFREFRVRGEWFRRDAALNDFLNELTAPPTPDCGVRKRKRSEASAHPLAKYRTEQQLTLEQFAERVGCTKSLLSRIENRILRPTAETAKRIEDLTAGVVPAFALRPDLWDAPKEVAA